MKETIEFCSLAELPVESLGCEGLPSRLLPPSPRHIKGHCHLLIDRAQKNKKRPYNHVLQVIELKLLVHSR